MNLPKRVILFMCLTTGLSCQQKMADHLEYEQAVMKEIFPTLIDSIWVEIRFSQMPPPVTETYDSAKRQKVFIPMEKDESLKQQIIDDLKKIKQHDERIFIVVNDTIHKIYKNEITAYFQPANSNENREAQETGYQINLEAQTPNKAFQLISSSQFTKMKDSLAKSTMTLSEIHFSRILFDTDRKTGILTCEYQCGGLCGNGYRVFIKKINGSWVIDKIEEAWIA